MDKDVCRHGALANLRKSTWFLERVGNVLRSQSNDGYEATPILFHEVIRTLPVKGTPVVLATDRDCPVITSADDVGGLTQMCATGHAQIEEGLRVISGTCLILRVAPGRNLGHLTIGERPSLIWQGSSMRPSMETRLNSYASREDVRTMCSSKMCRFSKLDLTTTRHSPVSRRSVRPYCPEWTTSYRTISRQKDSMRELHEPLLSVPDPRGRRSGEDISAADCLAYVPVDVPDLSNIALFHGLPSAGSTPQSRHV